MTMANTDDIDGFFVLDCCRRDRWAFEHNRLGVHGDYNGSIDARGEQSAGSQRTSEANVYNGPQISV